MTELRLYTNPMSRGRTARWMVEEIAAAGGPVAEIEILDFGPPMRTPAYLALNPMGKVPTLVHGDAVITETAAICAYLADAFPETGLAPAPASPARGPYYRWLFFASGPLEAAVSDRALGLSAVDPKVQSSAGYGSLERVTETLERTLSGVEHLAGDRFSAADLYLASVLGWATMSGGIGRRPAFDAYIARHTARPAARRAREKDGPMPG